MEKKNNSNIRILQITTIDLTAFCFLRNWFRYLVDKGLDVTYAGTINEFRDPIEKTGVKVVNIPIARSVNPVSDFLSLINLYKFIKKEKFDAVQTYTTKAGMIGRLAAKLAGVPVIIHNMLEPPHNSAGNPLLKSLYITMERIATNWADHIITTTQPNVREILDKKLVPKDKLTAIPEGLEMEKYVTVEADAAAKRKELEIPEGAPFILTVARLEAMKGHVYLLEAVPEIIKEFPDARFICVGKGRLKESLEKKAEEMGLSERVTFTGFRDDMLEILKSCDLFVLPSLWEGQGVVLMEAMALKKPLVACGVGGVVDVVVEGKTGYLVPPRDPKALVEAIVKTLKDPENMKAMGEAGFERVATEFVDAEFNDRRFKVYKKLFHKKMNVELE